MYTGCNVTVKLCFYATNYNLQVWFIFTINFLQTLKIESEINKINRQIQYAYLWCLGGEVTKRYHFNYIFFKKKKITYKITGECF